MTMYIRRLIQLGLGIAGGLAAWPLMELMIHVQGSFSGYLGYTAASGAIFGFIFGAFIGGAEGIIASRGRRILTGTLAGALIGAAGGALGFVTGQGVLFLVGDRIAATTIDIQRVALPVGRAIGWAILGACVGAAGGIRSIAGRKILIGALGGFVGGIAGGAVVEYGRLLFVAAPAARLVGLILLGALIGLAYAWIEKRLSFGVFRILNGPYKSREFILNQRKMTIGTLSRCDIPLPAPDGRPTAEGKKQPPPLASSPKAGRARGYRGVEPTHCRVLVRGRNLYLQPVQGAVRLNDEKVTGEGETRGNPLKFDDVIACGEVKFLYMRG